MVKKTVKSGKHTLALEDGDKQTLLHAAANECDMDTLAWLLKHAKAGDLKKRDKTGWTPLHVAGYTGNMAIYEALLKKGASPNAQNAHLTSPFVYLCRYVLSEAIKHLFLALLTSFSLLEGANPLSELVPPENSETNPLSPLALVGSSLIALEMRPVDLMSSLRTF